MIGWTCDYVDDDNDRDDEDDDDPNVIYGDSNDDGIHLCSITAYFADSLA